MSLHVFYAHLKLDFIFKIWLGPRSLESSMLSMEHNMPFKDDLKGFCSELTIPSYNFDHSDTSSVLNKWEDINTLSALYYGIFRSSYKK